MKSKSELEAELDKVCRQLDAFTKEWNTKRRGGDGTAPTEITSGVIRELLFEKVAILEKIQKIGK